MILIQSIRDCFNNPIKFIDPSGFSPENKSIQDQIITEIAKIDALNRYLASLNVTPFTVGNEYSANETLNELKDNIIELEQSRVDNIAVSMGRNYYFYMQYGIEDNNSRKIEEIKGLIGFVEESKKGKTGSWEKYTLSKELEIVGEKGYISRGAEESIRERARNLFYTLTGYNIYGISESDIDKQTRTNAEVYARMVMSRQVQDIKENASQLNKGLIVDSWWIQYFEPEIVSLKEINNFINKKGNLTDKQIEALFKINDYAGNKIVKGLGEDEPLILFFEGAGNYTGSLNPKSSAAKNKMHSKGRFGAMALVVKDGKIVYMSLNASTLPDNPQDNYGKGTKGHATALSGVYYIKSDYAGGSQKHIGFATGTSPNPQEGKGDKMPVYRFYDINGKYKPGVYDSSSNAPGGGNDIHAGWDKPTNASSTGCIVIYSSDYQEFMDVTGLNNGIPTPNSAKKADQEIGRDDKNRAIYAKLPVITGVMIIDRTLTDPDYLKEMYKTDDAVDIIMSNN